MELDLRGKSALVTGSSSGLGKAIALELAAEGVSVVIHGRDRKRGEAVVRQIEATGGRTKLALGDLTDDTEADAVADTALAAFDGIDILVNNAGGVIRIDNPEWETVSSDVWLASFNLNVVTIIRMAKRLSPGMVERGWGRIINISSVGGSTFSGRLLDYGSAKAAVDHVTVNLSKNLAPKGVTVNTVIPGTMLTPQSERWLLTMRKERGWSDDFAENERLYTRDISPQPIPRLGRPAEIASAVVFLASPRSDYTTGAQIYVDGGARGR